MRSHPQHVLPCLLILAALATGLTAQSNAQSAGCTSARGLPELPLHFVENHGVFPPAVAYHVHGADKSIFFTSADVTYVIHGKQRSWAVKLDFVAARSDAKPRGEERRDAVISYFKGAASDWKAGLPTFGRIVYRDLWPGIDLVYSGTVGRLKYEFRVKPGADPEQIRLRYRGATGVRVTAAGGLRITTPEGGFEDAAPVAYQTIDGARKPVEMAFDLDSDAGFGFRVGAYDSSRPLVLDPAVLVYCGYIGGAGPDYGEDIAIDKAGHAYVCGWTLSSAKTFPVKAGPFLTLGKLEDSFVAKVDIAGKALVYCGYFGGSMSDKAYGVAVDTGGNAYVVGHSSSKDFPAQVGPSLTFAGSSDAFIIKIDPTGTSIVYGGFIGGTAGDTANRVAVDTAGNAFVVGFTSSNELSFPVSGGPGLIHQGSSDGFIAKVDASGKSLGYCGYLGGSNLERCTDVALDPKGNAYVCGFTNSSEITFPVKVGPFLKHAGKYFHDAFVCKLDGQGAIVYCGFIGGTSSDTATGIAVDLDGAAYVVGHSNDTSKNFPATVGPDLSYNGGWYDGFIAKVNISGKSLDYCGFIGGDEPDHLKDVAVDAKGNAYVIGQARSTEKTFPVTSGPDLTYNGGLYDAFVARVNATGQGLDYCGYIGGTGYEIPAAIAADAAGNAFVIGLTDSDEKSFPVMVGPDLSYNGDVYDAWVGKISFTSTFGKFVQRVLGGAVCELTFVATGDAGRHFQAASSLGTGPIAIDSRKLALDLDPLLVASVRGYLPGVLNGYSGRIDSTGTATGSITFPRHRSLVGVPIHTSFITLDPTAPSGVRSISSTYTCSLQP